MSQKTAVILFNLGGPDSKKAIAPFLMNFFMDPNIIQLPIPLRCFVAKAISHRRSRREAAESYDFLGGSSPLLTHSKAQSAALERVLNESSEGTYRVFVCMRYWHPMAPQIVRDVRDWGADEIVLLPLYPQFSTTTSWSSRQQWINAADIAGYDVPTRMICCYPEESGFITASAEKIRAVYDQACAALSATAGSPAPRLLFSAHGLPEKIIRQGDPYQWQCEKTAAAIVEKLGIAGLDWQICYQSRVGPLKWIGPSTEDALEQAAQDKVPVIIYPHAFTQEHVETLVEIEIEYRELAHKLGVPGFWRVETVGEDPAFIAGLARLVNQAPPAGASVYGAGTSADGKCICPPSCGRCCMRLTQDAEKATKAA